MIFKKIINLYRNLNAVSKIIFYNILIFVIYLIINFLCFLLEKENKLIYYLGFFSDLKSLIKSPWTIFTYMFFHTNLLHILFNMYALYFFGNLFLKLFFEKKFYRIYFLGGIFGAIFFSLFSYLMPLLYKNSYLIGASASVMSILVSISLYAKNYRINVKFLGKIKLIYIGLIFVLLNIISIGTFNTGGHIAHLGGALVGLIFYTKEKYMLLSLKKLLNTQKSIHHMTDWEYNIRKKQIQLEVDKILDKISLYGLNSLTKEEKEFLNRFSKNEN